MDERSRQATAFAGHRLVSAGALERVVDDVKAAVRGGEQAPVLVFDDGTGRVIDVDLRGDAEPAPSDSPAADISSVAAEEAPVRRGPGRPKLGVVAGEVTLLPRHWEWLKSRPGGASVAIRKLVDEARRATEAADTARRARDAAYRFMHAIAGDVPGYEDAVRALYAGRADDFAGRTAAWPADVRDHARRLAAPGFGAGNREMNFNQEEAGR